MIKIEFNGSVQYMVPVGTKVYTVTNSELKAWIVRKAEARHTDKNLVYTAHWLEPALPGGKGRWEEHSGSDFYTSLETALAAFTNMNNHD